MHPPKELLSYGSGHNQHPQGATGRFFIFIVRHLYFKLVRKIQHEAQNRVELIKYPTVGNQGKEEYGEVKPHSSHFMWSMKILGSKEAADMGDILRTGHKGLQWEGCKEHMLLCVHRPQPKGLYAVEDRRCGQLHHLSLNRVQVKRVSDISIAPKSTEFIITAELQKGERSCLRDKRIG